MVSSHWLTVKYQQQGLLAATTEISVSKVRNRLENKQRVKGSMGDQVSGNTGRKCCTVCEETEQKKKQRKTDKSIKAWFQNKSSLGTPVN